MLGPLHSHFTLALLLFSSLVTAAENSERAIILHVIDAETGKPVMGAAVRRGKPDTFGVLAGPTPEAATDAMGKARWKLFSSPDSQSAGEPDTSLTITHSGYPSLSAIRIPRGQFTVEQNRPEILIKLQRGVRIGGVVKDAEGRPVANARVFIQAGDPPITYARSYDGLFQQRLFVSMVSGDGRSPIVRTDQDGRWSFTNAPPEADLYAIRVRREDGSESVFGTEFAQYATLFHMSQLGLPEVFMPWYPVTPVSLADLRAGKVVTILAPGYAVKGKILDQRGKPVPRARVRESYRRSDAESGSEVLTDSQGRFEFRNRHTGEVAYNIDAFGYASRTVFATISSNTPAIVARLEPARPARVQVLWDNQQPALGAKVMSNPNDQSGYQGKWSQIVDANGMVVWSNAPAPRALVWVIGTNEAPVEVYMKPGELTRVVLTNAPRQLIAAATTATRAQSTVTLNGVVRKPDGTPAAGGWILVSDGHNPIPYQNELQTGDHDLAGLFNAIQTVSLKADGQYQLTGLAPSYRLFVIHATGFLETTVSALAGNGTIQLQPWGSIDGQFFLNAGQPGPGESIHLTDPTGRTQGKLDLMFQSSTDDRGRFSFQRVPPGNYTLTHVAPNLGPWGFTHEQTIEVKAGAPTTARFGGNGMKLTGLVQADGGKSIDWDKAIHLLRALPGESTPIRNKTWTIRRCQYQIQFAADGGFHIDDVEPGRYELYVAAHEPPVERGGLEGRIIGLLTTNIVVSSPSGAPEVSLGKLILNTSAFGFPTKN